jgi:hypothetical protein
MLQVGKSSCLCDHLFILENCYSLSLAFPVLIPFSQSRNNEYWQLSPYSPYSESFICFLCSLYSCNCSPKTGPQCSFFSITAGSQLNSSLRLMMKFGLYNRYCPKCCQEWMALAPASSWAEPTENFLAMDAL